MGKFVVVFKSPYKTKYSSFRISQWPVYPELPSALPNCRDALTWKEGPLGH